MNTDDIQGWGREGVGGLRLGALEEWRMHKK